METADDAVLNVSLDFHKPNTLSQAEVDYLWPEEQTGTDYRAAAVAPGPGHLSGPFIYLWSKAASSLQGPTRVRVDHVLTES